MIGCISKHREKTIDLPKRKLISFHSYKGSSDSKNSIFLEIPDRAKNELKLIKVSLTHGAGCTPMDNFLVIIYTDDNGYTLIMDKNKFLEKELNSVNDTTVEKILDLNSGKWRPFTDSIDINYSNLKLKINSSKRIAISATMNDFALLKNPLSSSSLRHSNLIELIYE